MAAEETPLSTESDESEDESEVASDQQSEAPAEAEETEVTSQPEGCKDSSTKKESCIEDTQSSASQTQESGTDLETVQRILAKVNQKAAKRAAKIRKAAKLTQTESASSFAAPTGVAAEEQLATARAEEEAARSSDTQSQIDDSVVTELLEDIDSLEREHAEDPQVQLLIEQAKTVRAWDAYIAELAHLVKWRTAVPPKALAGIK